MTSLLVQLVTITDATVNRKTRPRGVGAAHIHPETQASAGTCHQARAAARERCMETADVK